MEISGSYGQSESKANSANYGPLGDYFGKSRALVQQEFRDMLLRNSKGMEDFAKNANVPGPVTLPDLDSTGLFTPQRAAFDQAIKQAFSRASGSSAMAGQLRPEHFSNVAASAAQNVLPSFAPMMGQNIRDAAMTPFQTALQSLQGKIQAQQPLQDYMKIMLSALGNEGQQQSVSREFNASAKYGTGGGGVMCWVAGALYGDGSPEQQAIRSWLLAQAQVSRTWAAFVALYRRYGERLAARMRISPLLTRLIRPIFAAILRRATI